MFKTQFSTPFRRTMWDRRIEIHNMCFMHNLFVDLATNSNELFTGFFEDWCEKKLIGQLLNVLIFVMSDATITESQLNFGAFLMADLSRIHAKFNESIRSRKTHHYLAGGPTAIKCLNAFFVYCLQIFSELLKSCSVSVINGFQSVEIELKWMERERRKKNWTETKSIWKMSVFGWKSIGWSCLKW